jgi:hypothetical protein
MSALLTQKNEETFDRQTAIRLEELHLLDMAMLELAGRPMFNYGKHCPKPEPKDPPSSEDVDIGGPALTVSVDPDTQELVVTTSNKTPDDGESNLETDLVTFVADLQNAVQQYLPKVPLRTIHKRKGQIFHGQNKFRGKVW